MRSKEKVRLIIIRLKGVRGRLGEDARLKVIKNIKVLKKRRCIKDSMRNLKGSLMSKRISMVF